VFQIAAEVAAPLSQCKKVTMVTSGKGDVGASKLTGEVFDIIERLPKMVEGMTGVELSKVSTSIRSRSNVIVDKDYEGLDLKCV